MKKFVLLPIVAVGIAMFGSSCYSDYGNVHAKRGAVVGGLVGAGAGALIGGHTDRELEGAAIGGLFGALAGGVLGSARDDEYYYGHSQPRYNSYRQPAPPYRSYNNTGSYYGGYSYGYVRPYYAPHTHHSYNRSYGSNRYCR